MKNSGVEWIGEIPEDWEVKPLTSLFSFGKGLPITKEDLKENGIPVLSYGQIHSKTNTGTNIQNDLLRYVDESYLVSNPQSLVQRGDFIFADTSEDLDGCGNCAYVNFDSKLFAGYHTVILKSKDCSNNQYLAYLFKTDEWRKQIRAGLVEVKLYSISRKVLKKSSVILPPKSTQQRIASYLDKKCSKIEETIQNQQQVIEKLKAYKQSLITEAVTGKVKIENGKACGMYEKYKDSGVEWIGEIPSEWSKQKLKFASQIMRGLFSHRPRNDPDYYDGAHPFIQTGEVARSVKYVTSYSQTLNELGFSVSREFPANTVLLTIAANVGDVAILNFNACFPDSVIGFYPKENVRKLFMFYVLKSMKEQFMRNAIISTQMNLNINIVKEEFIPLPSLKEQEEIITYLETKSDYIDTAIEQKQKLIEKLTEYKKSLIYECVTGKKEI